MGGLAVVLLQITKDQTKTQVIGEIDGALVQAQNDILGIVSNPAHCNANFVNKTADGTNRALTSDRIATCNTVLTGACNGIGAVATDKYIPLHTSDWNASNTKISNRVRISALTYSAPSTTAMVVGTGQNQGYGTIQNLSLNVTFQIKELPRNGVEFTRTVTKTFSVPVIVNGTVIKGCPKSANSTVPY